MQSFEAELTPLQRQVLDLLGVPSSGFRGSRAGGNSPKSRPRCAESKARLLDQLLHGARLQGSPPSERHETMAKLTENEVRKLTEEFHGPQALGPLTW
ncbi:MAG: hypothetical protein ACREUL_16965, partial [Steroidobacteraceae bacterium]